ncbi:hypothetical protein [Candidatus Karelsulcia muelleri]
MGVITNGTAVLSLGDIGPKASKPVMKVKALINALELVNKMLMSMSRNPIIFALANTNT